MTRLGSLHALANAVTDKEDVLVAKMQASDTRPSNVWNTLDFTERSSTMASTITSHVESWSNVVVRTIRPATSDASSEVIFPLSTSRAKMPWSERSL